MKLLKRRGQETRWRGNDLYIRCPTCGKFRFTGLHSDNSIAQLHDCQLTFAGCGHTARLDLVVQGRLVWVRWL